MNKFAILLTFLAFTSHAEEISKKSYTQEQLIMVRQNALNHAMEVLKDKKPSPDEILRVAKEFEAYMLADDVKKVKEQAKQEVSPNDFEKSQQPKVNLVSNEEKTSFSGLSLGINGQLKSTSAQVEKGGFNFDGMGQQNFIANLQADYEFKLNNRFGVMLGASVDLNDSELLKLNGKFNNYPSKDLKITEKNHFSLFVAPTYQLNDSTLGFVKLAYHRSKVEMKNNINFTEVSSWSQSSSNTLNGYGIGIGVRSHLYNNIYANLELQRVMYSTDSIITADLGTGTTIGSFGLSYSFNDDKKPTLLGNNSSGKFNGLSIGLNGLLKSSSIKTIATIRGESGTFDSLGQQNLGAAIFADYAFRVSDRALFLIGGTYDLNDSENFKVSGKVGDSESISEVKIKEKKHYSVFIAPAYQMSQTSLGYIKLAYHQAEFENINSASQTQLGFAKAKYSKDFNGYGIGLGFRTLITDNFYGNLEVQRVFYGKEDIYPATFDVSSTIGSLGLSYKF